jgi:hypothetical protein
MNSLAMYIEKPNRAGGALACKVFADTGLADYNFDVCRRGENVCCFNYALPGTCYAQLPADDAE